MMITIDFKMLNTEILDNLISQIVLREGTDYGIEEIPFEVKKHQLLQRLQKGEAVIIYNAQEDQCDIVSVRY